MQEKGFRGFPSLCFMDADGNVLAKPPTRTVASYKETMVASKRLLDLRQKGDQLSDTERKELFLAELQLDLIPAQEIASRSAAVKDLTAAEKAMIDSKMIDLEYAEITGKAREAGPEATGEKLAAMAKQNRIPSGNRQMAFWSQVLTHCAKAKDAELAKTAFAQLEAAAKTMPPASVARAKPQWQKLLDEATGK